MPTRQKQKPHAVKDSLFFRFATGIYIYSLIEKPKYFKEKVLLVRKIVLLVRQICAEHWVNSALRVKSMKFGTKIAHVMLSNIRYGAIANFSGDGL